MAAQGIMIFLSPAKTMDLGRQSALTVAGTVPKYQKAAAKLVQSLSKQSPSELGSTLGIKGNLLALNSARFKSFEQTPRDNVIAPVDGLFKHGAVAYDGPAYKALDAQSLPPSSISYLQQHLRILSGLYGSVRPCDLIQPYRLCMGSKLVVNVAPTKTTKDLYTFWNHHNLTTDLVAEMNGEGCTSTPRFIVNVASNEYSKVIDRTQLPPDILWIDCVFKDSGRILSFFAKRARGLMVRYCALNNVRSPDDLKGFDLDGYRFQPSESTATSYVFGRAKPPPQTAKKRQVDACATKITVATPEPNVKKIAGKKPKPEIKTEIVTGVKTEIPTKIKREATTATVVCR
eukprot:m.1024206 g.1024206  ORF g.1024206 m.1024206 type:complete len:345 (-) comp24099_c1_seq11:497-1531(-)